MILRGALKRALRSRGFLATTIAAAMGNAASQSMDWISSKKIYLTIENILIIDKYTFCHLCLLWRFDKGVAAGRSGQ